MEIDLGSEVVDLVSGFKGIVVGRTTFLNGCVRIGIQPKVDKEGKLPDAIWIDEPQLKVLKKPKIKVDQIRDTGGPLPSIPTRTKDCRR